MAFMAVSITSMAQEPMPEPVEPDTIVINVNGMKITIEVEDLQGLENASDLDLDELIEQIVAQSKISNEIPEMEMTFRFNGDSIATIHRQEMLKWQEGMFEWEESMDEWQEEMKELQEELAEEGFEFREEVDSLGNKKLVIIVDGFEYQYPANPNPNWFHFAPPAPPSPAHPEGHHRQQGESHDNDWEDHHEEILERILERIVEGKEEKDETPKKFGQTYDFFQVRAGFSNYLNASNQLPAEGDDNYALNTWRSNIFSFGTAFKTRMAGPLFLKYGVEIAFQDYFLQGEYFIDNQNGNTVFLPFDDQEVSSIEKSKLKTTTLNLPLMLMLDAGDPEEEDAFTLGVGGYAGYVIGSKSKTKFKTNEGNTQRIKDKGGFNLNEFQYGLQAQLGVKGVNLFMRYAVSDFFDQGNGPTLNGMSFGVVF